MLLNVKISRIVGILVFMSMIIFMSSCVEPVINLKIVFLTVPRRYFFFRSLVGFCVVCFSCFFVRLLLSCGHLLGKGWPLGSCWWCLLYFVTFPCGILGQVWYLIVSFPDLCHLSYFYNLWGLLILKLTHRHFLMTLSCNMYIFQVDVSDIFDIVAFAPKNESQLANMTGLLGNNDGDPNNDFLMRNLTILPPTSKEKELVMFGMSCEYMIQMHTAHLVIV